MSGISRHRQIKLQISGTSKIYRYLLAKEWFYTLRETFTTSEVSDFWKESDCSKRSTNCSKDNVILIIIKLIIGESSFESFYELWMNVCLKTIYGIMKRKLIKFYSKSTASLFIRCIWHLIYFFEMKENGDCLRNIFFYTYIFLCSRTSTVKS